MALLSLAQPGRFHDVGKSGVGRRVKLIITVIKIIENLGWEGPALPKKGASRLLLPESMSHHSAQLQ